MTNLSHVKGVLPKPISRCSSEDSAIEVGSKGLILFRPVIGETTRRSKIWLWATACQRLAPVPVLENLLIGNSNV